MTTSKRHFLAVVFFISGFSGLAYQVIWTRMAFASFGIITPVLSVVLSVYMLGLALGAWAGGRWIGWLTARTRRSALFFYGAAEGVIGIGAFAVPQLLKAGAHMMLSSGQTNSGQYLLMSALALTAAIFPWCFFMGTTFPFMMAYVREQTEAEAESFSFLYAANVLGAMAGCLLTAVVLVETLGFSHALWVAAGGNFLIALCSILTAAEKRPVPMESSTNPTPMVSPKTFPLRTPSRPIGWILFTTGFVSMAMEVVWTREFTPVLKTAVYSFALVVFTYLGATFAGAWFYRRNLRTGKIYSAAELLSILVVASCLPVILSDTRLTRLQNVAFLNQLESTALVLISICPFCGVLGYLTPSLIDEWAAGDPGRVGKAYGINVLGCILGPLLASYILLPWFSESRVVLMLTMPLCALYIFNLGALTVRMRIASALASSVVLTWSLFFAQDFEALIQSFGAGFQISRDYAASVIAYGKDRSSKKILVNGVGMTVLTPMTKMMVHLPLSLHEGPSHEALIICFGMGTSYRSALSWGLKTTAVELIPSVPKQFSYFHTNTAEVLRNPNGQIVIDDGRRFLERTRSSFDLIVIDPPPPIEAAGSSLLYSKEFYDAAKRHLNKNGLLETWYPSGDALTAVAIYRSLKESFPYIRCFHGMDGWGVHFVASMEPTKVITPAVAAGRLPSAAQKDMLEWSSETNPVTFLGTTIGQEFSPEAFSGFDARVRINDEHPFNEYFWLRSAHLLNY